MSRSIDVQIVALASLHHGAVSRKMLLDAGISRSAVDRRIGELLTVCSTSVYTLGVPTAATWLSAALLVDRRAAAAQWTAGELHALPTRRIERPVVVVPHDSRRAFPDRVLVRRTRYLPVSDVVEVEGKRVTSVERTMCDLAAVLSAHRLQRLIEWSITQDRMSAGSFRACAAGFCRRGRAGSARIRLLRHELLDAKPIAGSELERKGHELLRMHGLSGFRAQHTPPWFDGVRGTVDVAWPDAKLILELDGRRWHALTEAMAEDRRRDRIAAEHGWVVIRATWDEVVHRPGTLVDDLQSLLRQRRPRSGHESRQN
jgi:very-short-patch-repair endonuclease